MKTAHLIIIGRGTVGGALLGQLEDRRGALLERGLDLRIAGVADKDSVFGGPNLGWKDLTDRVEGMKLPTPPIVVDMTAAENGAWHVEWLRRGWSVVAANKKPISGPLAAYETLSAARDSADHPRYFHETTVGAGLPVLHLLRELLETGDRVIEIRAALSGTMGFIFSACGKGMPFAAAVAEARRLGYTEPDPRDDLSGKDIARKGLILGRMIGLRLELEDIAIESLADVPSAEIDARIAAAANAGRCVRYLASIAPGAVRVGIAEMPLGDPFAALDGPENLVQFRTARYDATPLVVRGPGAGAAVTAAGVFGDILRAAR